MAVSVALGVWLRAPALSGSLLSDDWDHFAMYAGIYPVERSPLDYYNFVSGDAAERREMLQSGRLPWWSDAEIHLGFLRPLASALVWCDYAVLGAAQAPERAHAHSAAWWAAGALAAAGVFREVLPPWAAVIAVALYAVDDAHALPVAWRASRSELIAVALMAFALWAHLDWKRRGRVWSRRLSIVLVWIGVLSGEHAIAMSAFLVACELCDRAAPLRQRLRTLVPFAVPLVLYFVVRASLGYGAGGSRFYMDPVAEPVRYLRALGTNVPLLVGDLVAGYPADYWYGGPPWAYALLRADIVPVAWLVPELFQGIHLAIGVGALALALAGYVAFGRRESKHAAALQWLIAGALLALLPLSGALAMTRLTVGPSLAAHAVLAWLAFEAVQRVRLSSRWVVRVGAVGLCVLILSVHGVNAAVRGRADATRYAAMSLHEGRWLTRSQWPHAGLDLRNLIVISARDIATQFSLPFVRVYNGLRPPKTSQTLLPPVNGAIRLERPSANVLDIRPLEAFALLEFRTSAYRLADADFRAGERFTGERFDVLVLAVANGLPTHLRYEFKRTLDDPSYLFMYPVRSGLVGLRMPAVGKALELPSPAWPGMP